MGTVQRVNLIVIRESSRPPSGFCRMTIRTGIRNTCLLMVGIGRLVIAAHMAITTYQGGAGISVGMTISAGGNRVCAGERKRCVVVIKAGSCISGRMTGKAGWTVIKVSVYTGMFFIRIGFVVIVAIDATELTIIRWIGMTIRALLPFPVMLT